ncbi:Hint domain-containing protein [Methylobacterium sp. J-078]|nr:Hint domain-containing protein [Methylobacterium sp. J-078]
MTVLSGGTVDETNVSGNANLTVENGGSAYNTNVQSSSFVRGYTSNTIVYRNGVEQGQQGGVLNNSVIQSGGRQVLFSGSTSYNTVLETGGVQYVNSQSTAIGTVINGGAMSVGSNASISDVNLKQGGILNFSSLDYDFSNSGALYNPNTNFLTVSGRQASVSVKLSGTYDGLYFIASRASASNGGFRDIVFGTTVTLSTVPCFVAGTLIQTNRGLTLVEKLSISDKVLNSSGQARAIHWIGTRHIDCIHHPRPEAVWPIRVRAHAFGQGRPTRDLLLSPDHSVCVTVLDEVLIPIKHLLNDATVIQVPTEKVTYWHVELDSHDILLAEGLPAESFLDTGVRADFENGADHMTLHPDFSPLTLADFCRPLVQEGPIVDAVRLRLLARASELGWTLTGEDDLHAVVDGAVVYPKRGGTAARFAIPAGAQEIRLVSRSFVPERVHVGAGDGRRLGVPVRGLAVEDGAGETRSLPIGSEALNQGFSFVQGGSDRPWRWTTGEAIVPPILWAGTEGGFSLVVELAPEEGTLRAWQAPALVTSQEASEASPEAAAA